MLKTARTRITEEWFTMLMIWAMSMEGRAYEWGELAAYDNARGRGVGCVCDSVQGVAC